MSRKVRELWTHGAEFELADWEHGPVLHLLDTDVKLDRKDVTMVNSNGIAVDPKGKLYDRGGEVLAEPGDIADVVGQMLWWRDLTQPTINYRCNLHWHIRVPGLSTNLAWLKRVQRYVCAWMPKLFPLIEPVPEPRLEDYPSGEAYAGAMARYRRRLVSHQTVLPAAALERQLAATTPEQFFEEETRDPKTGRVHWTIHPRCAVHLRQLLQTDTIEFRHFPGTLDPAELTTAGEWCRDFLVAALFDQADPVRLFRESYSKRRFPTFRLYNHELERRYRLTSRKHVPAAVAARNIERLLAGASPEECTS